MIDKGALQPRITATYRLEDYARAYDDVANRRIRGKTVFTIR
jgi:NADPH:quinone reductase-like Zn-dependent oxidoreductase